LTATRTLQMQHELVVDGTRFSDYDGFVREFNRAYLAVFGGPPWDGEISDLHDLLESAREGAGECLTIRWINSKKSSADLGHEEMAEFCLQYIASIPEGVFSPASYRLVHGWNQESLDQARAGQGRTLFEWLVWQMTGDDDEPVDLELE
jgi:hypothetical protein